MRSPVKQNRLRKWCILLGGFFSVFVLGLSAVFISYHSVSDLIKFEGEATQLGINLHPDPPQLSEPERIAHALRIKNQLRTIQSIGSKNGNYGYQYWFSKEDPSQEFIAYHQNISSHLVKDLSKEICSFTSTPLHLAPNHKNVSNWHFDDFFIYRLIYANDDEFTACIEAQQVIIDMLLQGDYHGNWVWFHAIHYFCKALRVRLADQPERLQPVAIFLDKISNDILKNYPNWVEQHLLYDFDTIRDGEQYIKETGINLPNKFRYGFQIDVAVRMERYSILLAELEWLQFIKKHTLQIDSWLGEAICRETALKKTGSWLTPDLHLNILFNQNPRHLRSLIELLDQVHQLAADIRQQAP